MKGIFVLTLVLMAGLAQAHDLGAAQQTLDPTSEAVRFADIGFTHLWGGWDHLAFLAALLLGGGGWKRWLAFATAFTLAHSLSLALVVLGVLAVPSVVVEPLIALSIVVVATWNLSGRRDLGFWWALGFGLLHGLGFAGALTNVGLPTASVPWTLLWFNLGLEAAQISFLAVAGLLTMVAQRWPACIKPLTTAGSLFVGILGATWFGARVLGGL